MRFLFVLLFFCSFGSGFRISFSTLPAIGAA